MTTAPRILVLGGSGMLGHKLLQLLQPAFPVFATFRNAASMHLASVALANIDSHHLLPGVDALNVPTVARAIEMAMPNLVINCIGVVKQSSAMGEAESSMQINAEFPHQLARLCRGGGIRLLHFSTDCVFSGSRGNYSEADVPDPVDNYGRSKFQGEVVGDGCLTLRTSIIGWELEHHRSLLGWFASQRGRAIGGYSHAIFSGLPTSDIAALVANVVIPAPGLEGLFHVSSNPISKLDLLSRLRDALGWQDIRIVPDASVVCNRSLSSEAFQRTTGWRPVAWDEMIARVAMERAMYEVEAAGERNDIQR
jgi:dTDP-4-dehydrorhamnose reductase